MDFMAHPLYIQLAVGAYRLLRRRGYHTFWKGWVNPRTTVLLERLRQIIKSSDFIRNRIRDLSACSIVHQPTTPPRAQIYVMLHRYPIIKLREDIIGLHTFKIPCGSTTSPLTSLKMPSLLCGTNVWWDLFSLAVKLSSRVSLRLPCHCTFLY
jgi:hypothetical protein